MMENLIKLTVKTPNQRVEDIQIDCDLQWTVRKLKEYLRDVYPSNPDSSSQKLIYLGKLLQDHLSLKEVFGGLGSQTLHLVCSDGSYDNTKTDCHPPVAPNAESNSGMRFRGRERNSIIQDSSTPLGSTHPLMFHQLSSPAMSEQQQQQYQHEMQQYMQRLYEWQMMMSQWPLNDQRYLNNQFTMTGRGPFRPNQTTPADSRQSQVNQAVQQEDVREQQPDVPPAPVPPNGDNEPNARNQDWLDWIYLSLRGLMLLSIIYFYSSTSRFLMVFMLGFIIYLYKSGWFTPQRVPIQNEPQPARADEVERNDELPSNDNENNNVDGETENTDNINVGESRLGILMTIWTLIGAFFSSLIPTPPPRPIEN